MNEHLVSAAASSTTSVPALMPSPGPTPINCDKVYFLISDSYTYDAMYAGVIKDIMNYEDILHEDTTRYYQIRMKIGSLSIDGSADVKKVSEIIAEIINNMYIKYNCNEIDVVIPHIKNYWLVPALMKGIVEELAAYPCCAPLMQDEALVFMSIDMPTKTLLPFPNVQPYDIAFTSATNALETPVVSEPTDEELQALALLTAEEFHGIY